MGQLENETASEQEVVNFDNIDLTEAEIADPTSRFQNISQRFLKWLTWYLEEMGKHPFLIDGVGPMLVEPDKHT